MCISFAIVVSVVFLHTCRKFCFRAHFEWMFYLLLLFPSSDTSDAVSLPTLLVLRREGWALWETHPRLVAGPGPGGTIQSQAQHSPAERLLCTGSGEVQHADSEPEGRSLSLLFERSGHRPPTPLYGLSANEQRRRKFRVSFASSAASVWGLAPVPRSRGPPQARATPSASGQGLGGQWLYMSSLSGSWQH